MREAGLTPQPIHVVHDEGAILPETGAKALRMIKAETPDVDALFFTSDVFAVGAVLACRELGIAVPDEIGIAGFHDLEIGRVVSPTLTTVHVPAMEMGRKAGEMILARLSGSRLHAARGTRFHHSRARKHPATLGVKLGLISRHAAFLTRKKVTGNILLDRRNGGHRAVGALGRKYNDEIGSGGRRGGRTSATAARRPRTSRRSG